MPAKARKLRPNSRLGLPVSRMCLPTVRAGLGLIETIIVALIGTLALSGNVARTELVRSSASNCRAYCFFVRVLFGGELCSPW